MQFNHTRKRITLAVCTIATGLTLSAGAAHAQFNQFQTALGGTNIDGGRLPIITTQEGGIIPTWDENLITVSDSRSYGNNYDVYVAQLDPCGDLMWSRTYDLGGDDHGVKIRQCPDGDYAIVGYVDRTQTPGQERDAFLMKIDRNGNVRWARTYGVLGRNKWDEGKDLRVDQTNGNIYACGFTKSSGAGNYDGWIWSTDPAGNPLWSNTYGASEYDYLNALELGCDGSIVATGTTSSFSAPDYDYDLWIVKVARFNGAINYSTIHGEDGTEEGKGITMDSDGIRFYVVGYTAGDGGPGMDALAGQFYCETGLCQLARNFGGTNNNDICFNDVVFDPTTPNPGVWIAGSNAIYGLGTSSLVLTRLTTPGLTSVWGKLFYWTAYGEYGYSLTPTLFDNNPRYGLATIGSTLSFGMGQGDVYTVGTNLAGESGCHEESWIPPYKDYQPYKNDYVTVTVLPFTIPLTTTHTDHSNTDFTRICSGCYPSMIAPPGGGNGDLSRNDAVSTHMRVDLQPVSPDADNR